MNFEIGDFIVGVSHSPYSVTNENMTKGVVVEGEYFERGKIWVKVLEHELSCYVDDVFDVSPRYFLPYVEPEEAYSIRLA